MDKINRKQWFYYCLNLFCVTLGVFILTIPGFVGISGLQRFATNDIGILYFFTGGLSLIDTVFDLIGIKEIVYSYNIDIASNILAGFNQGS